MATWFFAVHQKNGAQGAGAMDTLRPANQLGLIRMSAITIGPAHFCPHLEVLTQNWYRALAV
jgi:hypothetical protein